MNLTTNIKAGALSDNQDGQRSTPRRRFRGKRLLFAILGMGLGLLIPSNIAKADNPKLEDLTARWWQWALSIPTAQNPQIDPTGGNCMVGQRGSVWFLAGIFGGGTASRTCSIPEDTVLFFPVINAVNFNTPNVCGQGPQNLAVKDLRQASAASIRAATNLKVSVDGKPIQDLRHILSDVFEIALPEQNIFDAPCMGAGLGNVPVGIYSPAVDEGFYVSLDPLKVGNHTLHFHADGDGFTEDVTYKLTVVPVLEK